MKDSPVGRRGPAASVIRSRKPSQQAGANAAGCARSSEALDKLAAELAGSAGAGVLMAGRRPLRRATGFGSVESTRQRFGRLWMCSVTLAGNISSASRRSIIALTERQEVMDANLKASLASFCQGGRPWHDRAHEERAHHRASASNAGLHGIPGSSGCRAPRPAGRQ